MKWLFPGTPGNVKSADPFVRVTFTGFPFAFRVICPVGIALPWTEETSAWISTTGVPLDKSIWGVKTVATWAWVRDIGVPDARARVRYSYVAHSPI